jgi:hypothetical protein
MTNGQVPAVLVKTWNPGGHGRNDYFFCLWEAKNPADIKATLKEFSLDQWLTADIMEADEIDWAALAKAGS